MTMSLELLEHELALSVHCDWSHREVDGIVVPFECTRQPIVAVIMRELCEHGARVPDPEECALLLCVDHMAELQTRTHRGQMVCLACGCHYRRLQHAVRAVRNLQTLDAA